MFVINENNYEQFSHVYPYVRYCAEDYYNKHWILPERIIKDYEIIFVLDGEGEFYIDGQIYRIKKHNMLIIKPDIIHKGQSIQLPFRFLCIHFDLYLKEGINTALLEDVLSYGNIPEEKVEYKKGVLELPELIHIENSGYIQLLFQKIINENKKRIPGYQVIIQSLFLIVLFDVFRQKNNLGMLKIISKHTEEIVKFIKLNYSKKITLNIISQNIYLQPSYISNLFKKETGITIKDFINRYRVVKTKEMLLLTERSVQDIAEHTGFCDVHHFTKTFKKYEGLTPGQYRRIKRS